VLKILIYIILYILNYIIDSFVASIEYELSNLNNYYYVRYLARWKHNLSCGEFERVARFVGYLLRAKGRDSWPSIIVRGSP
jgi:hypothetical protein